MRIFFAHGGGEAFARWREEQGQTAAGLGDLGRDRRGARRRLAHLARGAAASAGPGAGGLRRAARRRRRLPRLAAVGAGPAVHRRRPADMTVIQDLPIGVAGGGADAWAWQDVLAEGVSVGAPPDAFNSQGQDWGSPPLVPVAAARRRLRAVHPVDPGHDGRRRRAADRPRHGPVPAVVGAVGRDRRRRRVRPLPGRGPARHRRPGEPPGAGARRRRGPRHGRGRRPRGHGRARRPVLPAAVVRGRRPGGVAGRGDGRHHHARPADRRGAVDRRRTSRSSGSTAPGPTRSSSAAGRRCSAHLPGLRRRRAPPRRRSSGRTSCWPGRRRLLLSATLDDAVGEVRRPNMPGADDRPNWSLPLPVAGRGPAGAPAAADGRPDAGRRASPAD